MTFELKLKNEVLVDFGLVGGQMYGDVGDFSERHADYVWKKKNKKY